MHRPRVLKCGRHNWIVRVNERQRVASEPTDLTLTLVSEIFVILLLSSSEDVVAAVYGHR